MDMPVRSETPRSSELGDIANRAEKGSAMRMISAEAKATNDKTTRLRALRLAREAEEAVAAAAIVAAKPVKRTRKAAAKAV
ncbi:hypothetical protein [Aureimonas phyllosphaerae]|uniref:Uncharacterized protein n=1 Tax=Aureimonas phyllosphaerae TaxID=1166078 RepID=A0A7W6FTD4_9HYPH|nr:hypothetical protein [Aureimonas phyllosphaerae]MBB3933902.1 hypothetical protein [Aureimonas phyllosphaerae]MBB3958882.1 hypothetical protein [Aureimonas phyllosphaerae]SFF20601.1 hypothetical protein SAMN05216566_104227 [Aureimonas phyllosphaerae]